MQIKSSVAIRFGS